MIAGLGAIASGFLPLEEWIYFGEWVSPLDTLLEKTVILFRWLRIVLSVLGAAGLVWLYIPTGWRTFVSQKINAFLLSQKALPAILALNFALNVGWIVFYANTLYADSIWYFERGAWLADGQGYVYDAATQNLTAAFPVGYPFFLSLLFRLTGPHLLVAKLANVMLATGSVYLTYRLVAKLFDQRTASLAALLFGTLPGLIVYGSLVSSDLLFLFLTLWICFETVQETKAWWRILLAGLVNGVAGLARSIGLLLPPFWIGIRGLLGREADPTGSTDIWKQPRALWKWGGLFAAGMLLVILPWTMRNYLVFGKIIPVSNNGGLNFWMGNNPRAYGGFVSPFFENSPFIPLIGDEVALDEKAYALGWQFVRSQPVKVLRLLPAKAFYLLNSNDAGLEWNRSSGLVNPQAGSGPRAFAFVNLIYLLEMGAAGLGLVMLALRRERRWGAWVGALFSAYWIALHLPFFGKDRFALPILPFLLAYAAVGLLAILDYRGKE
ncbi:MAG TPA: hypothetical protein EYP88_02175 [Anaerolineales bacterium]|nr:hypothetical protein [Anaerolineales bacterium]